VIALGRRERPIDLAGEPLASFAAALRELRESAGSPTYRELARRAHFSATALSEAAGGVNLPTLAVSLAYVRACGGDVAAWSDRWRLAAMELGRPDHPSAPDKVTTEPATVRPAQLPAAVGYFTGRQAELTALSELIQRPDQAQSAVILAIGGTPGVGKTALAVYWAHQVSRRFPDGQLYANLRGFDPSAAPTDPAETLHGFLGALGVSAPAIPVGLEARAALYRSRIRGQRMLIVLDDARDEQQVRPLLPGSASCTVVVTSRNRLGGLVVADGAYPISLDVLTQPEASELLTRRLGREWISAEPAAAAALAQLSAGLPLALNLVVARAVADPHRLLTGLATELAAAKLDILNVGDVETSVRAVFSCSYRGLSSAAARAFRLLGVHPGPDIALPAAASLLGQPREQARAVLEELTWSHLISRSPADRYGFHDLLRAYAAELAQQDAAEGQLEDGNTGADELAARLTRPLPGPRA
jgi:hypothetical protein